MSECVVRMEMPKGCRSCQLCVFIGASPACVLRKYQNDTVSRFFVRNKRPSNCPIVCALPEKHGRLVDADEIIEAIDEDIELDSRGLDDMTITGRVRERLRLDRGYKKGFNEYLVKRPTIVPATEGGNHEAD